MKGVMMQPPATVRGWLLDGLRKNIKTMGYLLANISQTDATTYRDDGNGWTALEVVCHLRDYEALYFERSRLTVEQDSPPLPFPNQEDLAKERDYNTQNLQTAYNDWVQKRDAFLSFLESLDEAAWTRTAQHPKRGLMTLTDQLALTSWHDVNHIEQVARILNEKKSS
jgi:hypothetical protein